MRYLYILLAYSTGSLAFAYGSQYWMGLEPCVLCLYQRVPFFVVLALVIAGFFMQGKTRLTLLTLCGVALIVGAGIAFFHVGVEQGKFTLQESCVDEMTPTTTLEAMREEILGKSNVPCDKPQWVFMGLSMAAWNLLFSGFMGLMTLIMSYNSWRAMWFIHKAEAYYRAETKDKNDDVTT